MRHWLMGLLGAFFSLAVGAKEFGTWAEAAPPDVNLASALQDAQDQNKQLLVVRGRITKVCQKKGCWMILSDGDAWARVMTGHRFFLPKDASGQAWVYGTLVRRELGERKARHYVEESGSGALPAQAATQEWQIDAIGVRLGE